MDHCIKCSCHACELCRANGSNVQQLHSNNSHRLLITSFTLDRFVSLRFAAASSDPRSAVRRATQKPDDACWSSENVAFAVR